MNHQARAKFRTRGFVLIGAVWQIVSLFSDSTQSPTIPKGDNIVALGDSLTSGVGASDAEHGYISVLQSASMWKL